MFAKWLAAAGAIAVWSVLSGTGVCRAERTLALDSAAPQVGRYACLELEIDLDESYENPFDPAEVDLRVVFESPSGKRVAVPAFSYQPYERRRLTRGGRPADWYYPVGLPRWKARFAPAEEGQYVAVAELKDRQGEARSAPLRFRASSSANPGFLRIARRDPRFFEFDDGRPFFAIGQNLAFIGSSSQYADLSKAEAMFGRLAENGANYLRVWTCCEDWAMAIEARKSAWGRSWDWRPPLVPMPGDDAHRQCIELGRSPLQVSPSHAVALRPETPYVLQARLWVEAGEVSIALNGRRWDGLGRQRGGGWIEVREEFTTARDEYWLNRMTVQMEGGGKALLDRLTLTESAGGSNLLWEADINRPALGRYNPVDSFMLDELIAAAEQRGIYVQLCLLTRDLYMKSLKNEENPEYAEAIAHAKRFMRYAVARWGCSTHVAAWEYFNEMDPGLPTDRFYRELGEYLEEIDIYGHLRTTSAWGPSPKDCRHPKLDIAEVHFYLRPSDEGRLRDEVHAALDRAAFLREHAPHKPTLIGEFGLATEKWGLSDRMKADRELTHFRHSLWASTLSGVSGTALFWWWEDLDRMDCYHHYRPLAEFVKDIPWTTARLNSTSARVNSDHVDVIGLQGSDRAYLWLFDRRAAWMAGEGVKGAHSPSAALELEISGLEAGQYRILWWDTRRGGVVGQQSANVAAQPLRIVSPPLSGDIACKLVPADSQ